MGSLKKYGKRAMMVGAMIFSIAVSTVTAQSLGEQLRTQLEGKSTLAEIMTVVDAFYQNVSEDMRDKGGDGLIKLKHWKRWEWYMARRLGANGAFVNIPKQNLAAMRQRNTSRAPRRQSVLEGEWISLGMIESSHSADSNITYPTGSTGNSYANGTGRVDRIAFHPTDPDIIYVGTPYGGLWRTEDGGSSWEPLTDQDTLNSIGISGVVVTPSSPDLIYVLTGTGDDYINSYGDYYGLSRPSLGVRVSDDGGETWGLTDTFPTSPGVTNYDSYDLVQGSTNPAILFAATSDGIFRTTDSGDSWIKVKTGLHHDLQFKPGSDSVLYATDYTNVYYSIDTGSTWITSALNIAPGLVPNRIALGVTPANPSIVYAFMGNAGYPGQFSGIYVSHDSGINFTRRARTPNILGYELNGSGNNSQSWYDLCIAVHPDSAHLVSLGSINIWRSADSCHTVSNNTGWFENQGAIAYAHCDHHALAFNPLDNKLYSCNDGGVWASSDFGDTFTNISKGLVVSTFYHLTQAEDASYKMAGGTQDNGVKYRAAGINDFVHMYGADGFSPSFMADNPDKFYASLNSSIYRFNYVTGSATFLSTGNFSFFFKEVIAHPTDSNIVFAGGYPIYRSTNQGASWTNVGGKGGWALAIARSHPSRMYAAGGQSSWPDATGTVYTSANSGLSWTPISENPGFPPSFSLVTDIAVDPVDSLVVYVTIGGYEADKKVFRSADAGQTWTNLSYNLPNVAVLSAVATQEEIFVGTDISVYHLTDGDTEWTDIGSNLPQTAVTDILYDHVTGTLTAATFGRGVWQRNVCVDDITLTYPLEGALQYSCDDQFVSTSEIPGNAIDSVHFRANGKIKLTPGFKVGTGAFFKAEMEACDQGNIPLQMPSSGIVPAGIIPALSQQERRGAE